MEDGRWKMEDGRKDSHYLWRLRLDLAGAGEGSVHFSHGGFEMWA